MAYYLLSNREAKKINYVGCKALLQLEFNLAGRERERERKEKTAGLKA